MQAKNPSGLPPRNPERLIPRNGAPEQDWWLRNNDRSRERTDGGYTYFNTNPLTKKNFQVGALEKDHSRRVFKELARQGHSFSESNLQALQQDREIRKSMQKRYWEVMCKQPGPPGPTKPALRSSSSQPSLDNAEPASKVPATWDASSRMQGADGRSLEVDRSRTEISVSALPAHSQLSATAPAASRVSVATASQLPAAFSVVDSRANGVNEVGSAVGQGVTSNLHPSALSVSDFYAWRPRLLR
jgi:hypothetical protein